MNTKTAYIAAAAAIACAGMAAAAVAGGKSGQAVGKGRDYASLVNPFIGTGGHGHTFPGAVVPHGMIQPSPDTRIDGWDACSGYYIADTLINGFSHTHVSGTGCADYGDVLMMPTVGNQAVEGQADTLQNLPYASSFSHKTEVAEPGYYAVTLDRYGVRAEMTATDRVALHRFTFPQTVKGDAGLIIDMDYSIQHQDNLVMEIEAVSDTEIRGYKMTKYWAFDQGIHFYAKFSEPFTVEYINDTLTSSKGKPYAICKAKLRFPGIKPGGQLLAKVGISAVDHDGARANVASEMPGFDFDGTRIAAREKWNRWLSRIDVPATADADDLTKFYTALYHTAIAPNLFTDADGRYLGMDRRPKQGSAEKPVYTIFSTWDTFRALHPMLTIIAPELNDAFLNSLLLKAREGGILPMWELASNYTGTMIGYHTAAMLADAVAKGQNTFSPEEALKASVRAAEYDPEGIVAPEAVVACLMPQAKYYKNLQGWIPSDKDHESVAKALEYAYDDWAISQLAEAVGDKATAEKYARLGKAYRHYFDPETRFMRGKMSDGSWRVPFSPNSSNHRNDDYCEGTAWQWTWFVPHDVEGLKELMGGEEAFAGKLDSLFSASSELTGELVSADITGLIGQYAHGNEPSHHVAHLYNYANQPWKTQRLIGQIFEEQYRNDPDGLSGNEDCGQMSAWLIMNAMGIYQVAPGKPLYSIGRPLFEEMTVNLPGGKSLRIVADNFSKENTYVESLTLNGNPIDTPFITHDQFTGGGELRFRMSPVPTAWGTRKDSGKSPADLVNPLVGTQSSFELSTGNTYPAIALPWGMNFWTPQTGENGSGWQYVYTDNKIRGIKQTHQPSPWINDYGAFSLMPETGRLVLDNKERGSWFSHKAEDARPYYYKVYLADYDVTAEVAPTERAAMMQFTYPATDDAFMVIDAFDGKGSVKAEPEKRRIVGKATNNHGGVPDNFANYFVIEFDRPFTLVQSQDSIAGIRFEPTRRGDKVTARVASSFISPEQAEQNLKELGSMTFAEVKEEGKRRWDDVLGRIEVEGGDLDQDRTFYSNLYRSLLFPRKFHEIDKDGNTVHYSPYNGQTLPGYLYTDTGIWDTFRALFPLLNLVYPSVNAEIQEGMLNAYRESGFFPEWASPGHRDCMVGNNSASILADAYLNGPKVADTETLWKGLVNGTENVHPEVKSTGRIGHQYYNRLGYVPYDVGINENAARTLEYAYDDWAIYQLAKALGRPKAEQEKYAARALNYMKLFDKETNLMRGRNEDGSFQSPFSPLKWGDAFTEGNAWHYTWSVFHDPQGLIDLMGGKKGFTAMMDSVFSVPPHFDDSYYGFPIHEIREMQVMDMGNYAHGNQPVQHMIYLYDWAGEPWKAQYWTREVMDKLYTPRPDGYCGDEDNGQTSAWYVFSSLGFYPVAPGTGEYALGSPLFKKARIHLENGKTVEIDAPGNSRENRYISTLTVDGKEYDKNFLTIGQLLSGAKIGAKMSAVPNKARGTSDSAAPYSFSDELRQTKAGLRILEKAKKR